MKAEFANSAASSLRTNDLLGSDRRPSSSLSAYPDQWMYHHHHRRLSGSPQAPLPTFSTDDLPYPSRILSQKTLENIPAALGFDLPNNSSATLTVRDEQPIEEQQQQQQLHSNDCIYSTKNSFHPPITNDLNSSMSETSASYPAEHFDRPSSIPMKTNCNCQLLWQLERDTDSIDKFKYFFKRDEHVNVDWDYVQGSSDV